MKRSTFSKTFLLLLVVAITAIFVLMIRSFLLTLLLSAIFSGLLQPVFRLFVRTFGGRRRLASLTTILLFVMIIVVPMFAFLGLLAREAFHVSESVTPWVQKQLSQENTLDSYLEKVPGISHLEPYRQEVLTRAGEWVGSAGRFLFDRLSDVTKSTMSFFFQFFLLVYSMFFFLANGRKILAKILFYMPLEHEDETKMLDKFISVSRATLMGSLVIGLSQGILAGIAFALVGLQGVMLWGTIMTLLSIIPGVGAALVWIPAVLYLVAMGSVGKAIFLGVFCVLVVGTIDNFMRPRIVGHDAKMHDLFILFGTLGGISLFGLAGVIVGPIVAALFITIWDIYGVVFKNVLPRVGRI